MNMLEEKERLKNLVGTTFLEKVTGILWRVASVVPNIYKDVVLKLKSPTGRTRELIEGSEDYYKNFKEKH